MRAFSPKEISKKKYEVIPWGEKWSVPFGKPAVNELWFISGASASGKSSFVMQLAKELCNYGDVLYLSYEEGISKSFQDRIKLFRMYEVQGRFRVVINDTYEEVVKRLQKHKSAHFVILDSLQVAGWSYDQMVELKNKFKSRNIILVLPVLLLITLVSATSLVACGKKNNGTSESTSKRRTRLR